MGVRVELQRKLNTEELMFLNCGIGEDSRESLGLQGDPTSPSWRSVLNMHWKDWCWSSNSNILATWCRELTHLKRLWFWERLRAGGEGDERGWDGWMASPTQWTWVWVDSRSCWWTGRPGMLHFMGSQRVGHDWVTELNWTLTESNSVLLRYAAQTTPYTLGLKTGAIFLLSTMVLQVKHHSKRCSILAPWWGRPQMGRLKWLWATSAEADCEFAVYLISGSFHGMSSCHFSSMSAQESHTLYTEAQSFNNDRSNRW